MLNQRSNGRAGRTRRLMALALVIVLLALLLPTAVSAAGEVPPKPDYCKSSRCVLGCMLPASVLAPFGSVSTNVALCRRVGAPLVWLVAWRGR